MMRAVVVLLGSAAAVSAFVVTWVVSRPGATVAVQAAALGSEFERGPLLPDSLVVEFGAIPVGAQAVAVWRFRNVSRFPVNLVSQLPKCGSCRLSAATDQSRVAEFTNGRSLTVPAGRDATVEFVVRSLGNPGPKRVEVRVAVVWGQRSWEWPLVAKFVAEDLVRVWKAPPLGDLVAYTVELASRESFSLSLRRAQNGLGCAPLDGRGCKWVVYGRALAALSVTFAELAREAAAPIKIVLR